jgi:predicted RNA-binding protein YlxR (DUF448 family)
MIAGPDPTQVQRNRNVRPIVNEPTEQPSPTEAAPERRPERTCVGCGRHDAPDELVRVVLGPAGEVAVDLAGGTFGRGAWVHASPGCIAKAAPRGLSRSFRATLEVSPAALAAAVAKAADRRVEGLLSSALRSRQATFGGDAVSERLASGEVELVVVARDAAAAATLPAVSEAVAKGRAVAWGTKARLGSLAGRADVAVLGIESRKLAEAVKRTVRTGSNVASKVVATEDR